MSSFLIEDAYQITGIGVVLVGKVTSGNLKPGMKARVDDRAIEIRSIEKNHQQLAEAKMGENVGINIKQLSSESGGFFARIFGSRNSFNNIFRNYK